MSGIHGGRVRRVAMWSGPRNLSSALMRSWGNRSDTFVCDEPLYAHYLRHTGVPHPGADEVIRSHETDWRKVTAWLTDYTPPGKTVFYQKHMAHHLLPNVERGWLERLSNAFLIRAPREVVASFAKIAGEPTLEDTGLPQQLALFNVERDRTGRIPPVVDARDLLQHPRQVLSALCHALELEFDDGMLAWPAGPRDTDGVWAKHWYDAVIESTGFRAYERRTSPVPPRLASMLDDAEAIYRELHGNRIH